MFAMLWLILHALALLAEGGVSSGSGEVAGANGGGKNANNNGVGGGAGAGINGVGLPQNGLQPLINPGFQLVPVGGSFFIQPFGNAQAPQGPVRQQQQLVPFGAFQQGAGGFFLGQQGAANLIPQAQGGLVQAGAGGAGGVPLYTVLSQHGGPQGPMFLQGQQVQLVPLNQQGQLFQNQLQQAAVLRGGTGNGGAAGRARARRSVAAHPRRMQAMAKTVATARTVAAEEEESSGMDTEELMTI